MCGRVKHCLDTRDVLSLIGDQYYWLCIDVGKQPAEHVRALCCAQHMQDAIEYEHIKIAAWPV